MAQKPDAIIAPWDVDWVLLLRQTALLRVFDQIQAWWQATDDSGLKGIDGSNAFEEVAAELGMFQGKLWATARYSPTWPDTPENKAFVERFTNRWGQLPKSPAEATYSAVLITKAAVEKARSLEAARVIEALRGMQLPTPARVRTFRDEDHQFVYDVPGGKVVLDPRYSVPVLGNVKVVPAADFYPRARSPRAAQPSRRTRGQSRGVAPGPSPRCRSEKVRIESHRPQGGLRATMLRWRPAWVSRTSAAR